MSFILIIDDHPLLLEGTLKAIQAVQPNVNCLTASNIQEAQHYLGNYQPEVVVMDLSLRDAPYTHIRRV